MIKMLRLFAGVALVATLAACGGGGGSAGTTAGSGGTTGTTGTGGTTTTANPTTQVTNFVMLLDKSTLPNAGTATAKLTVLAVNAQNNIVPGATVSVATDANSIYTPGGTVTDANGLYTGTVGFGADKSDRTITITTTVNGLVKKISLQVAGSQLALVSTPSVLSQSQTATFTARLTDFASQPITGAPLAFDGDITSLNGLSANTDANGNATLSFTAPASAGSYNVSVSGNGISNVVTLQVGAFIPTASIPASVTPSLAALPNVLAPNAVGSLNNQSQLKFLFIDSNNQPIPNVRVRFDLLDNGGSVNASINSGQSTVYTTAAGVATASFIAGNSGSSADGVKIRACYQAMDFTSSTQCDNSVGVTLTVAQQALAISIGDDNILQRGTGKQTYIKQFTITVADASGRAVANAPVDISVDLPYYGKGLYSQAITFPLLVQPFGKNTSIPNASTSPSSAGTRISCINEDLNRNGIVDPGENIDGSTNGLGQPTLQPSKADLVISYVNPLVTTTDATGSLVVQVEYPQQVATWLEYHVRASTNVAGSQGTAERAFITTFIKGDDTNGGAFLTPPYGINSCSMAN